MLEQIPSVEDDMVLVHASVDGFDAKGRRRMIEKAYFVEPLEINGKSLRAIQTTTAAPLCQSAMMLLTDSHRGCPAKRINPTEFLRAVCFADLSMRIVESRHAYVRTDRIPVVMR